MLFKVWVTEHFSDEPDRIGVIAAASLDNAIEKLQAWSLEGLAESGYERLSDAETVGGPDFATVTFQLLDTDGVVGQDCYMLVPHEGPLMFLAEDWRQVFS